LADAISATFAHKPLKYKAKKAQANLD